MSAATTTAPTPGSPHARRPRRALGAAAGLGAAVGLGLVPLFGVGAPGAGASTATAPAAVLAQSVAAAEAAHSVHIVAVNTGGSNETMDVGPGVGVETSTQSHQTLQMELVHHTIYLRAKAKVLSSLMGVATSVADTYANRWISTPSSATGVGQVAQVFSLSTIVGSLIDLTGPLAMTTGHTAGGQQVLIITGKLPSTKINQGGAAAGARATLTVAAAAPHAPVSVSYRVKGQGQTTFTFSAWGRPVHVPAPARSVPLTKVTGAG